MPAAFAEWVAVYVFPSVIGGGIYYAAYAVATIAISVGLSKVSAALMGLPKLPGGAMDRSFVQRGGTVGRTILYGEGVTAGVMAYCNTSGPGSTGYNNKFLDLVIAVAGHEVEALTDCWLDEEKIASADINSGNPAGGMVSGGKFAGYVEVNKYLGTDTQTASAALVTTYGPNSDSTALTATAVPFNEWTTDHRLRGCAYIHVRLWRNADIFPGGAPQNIRIGFKGAKVYDPRKDSTNGGSGSHRYEIPSTWEYSNNPALCVADYLIGGTITNSVTRVNLRGFGASTADVDWASVISAANVCDEQVAIPPAGSPTAYQARYACDGGLSSDNTPADNIEQLLTSMLGQMVYSSGKYRLYSGVYNTPVMTLGETDLAGGIEFTTGSSRSERYNAVKGVRWDSVTGQEVEFFPRTSESYAGDDGATLYRDIQLPFTVDEYRAQRIAQIILRRSREQQQLVWRGNLGCMRIGVWETVYVTLAELGVSNKVFRCVSRNITMDGAEAIVELTLREEFSTTYSDPLLADYGDLTPAEPVTGVDDAVAPPTGFTATPVAGGIRFEITPDDTNGTDVLYQLYEYTASTPYTSATLIWAGNATTIVYPKSDQTTRYYWVRARRNAAYSPFYPDGAGVSGYALEPGTGPQGEPGISAVLTRNHAAIFAYADGTVTATGLDSANGYFRLYEGGTLIATTSITYSVTAQVGCVGSINAAGYYSVTSMSANDASLALRAAYNGNNYDLLFTLSKTLLGYEIVNALPATNLFDGRIVYLTTDGKLYRYVTGTGWTTTVPAADITGTLTGLQIGAGTIDITKFATGIAPVVISSTPPTPAVEGMVYFDTDDNKLYRYDGASWIATVPASDITGAIQAAQIAALEASKITGQLTDAQIAAIAAAKLTGTITGTQIADGAITTAKITANSITSNEIAAGAITTDELAANSVTAINIQSATITGDKIQGATITGANIAGLTITGSNIAGGTITGTKIAGDTITAGNIQAGAIGTSELAAGAVIAEKILTGTITANEIAGNTITGNNIMGGTITAAKMATNTITAASAVIADGAITTARIADLAVDTIKITSGALTTASASGDTGLLLLTNYGGWSTVGIIEVEASAIGMEGAIVTAMLYVSQASNITMTKRAISTRWLRLYDNTEISPGVFSVYAHPSTATSVSVQGTATVVGVDTAPPLQGTIQYALQVDTPASSISAHGRAYGMAGTGMKR